MIIEIISYITILSYYSIVLSAILIIRQNKLIKVWPIIFFLTCVLLYLGIDYFPKGVVFKIALAGPYLVSFSFWLVSKSIFSDKPIPLLKNFILAIFLLVVYYILYFFRQKESISSLLPFMSAIISFSFIFLAIYEAQSGKEDDLIFKRKQLRTIFTYTISIIILITLMAELGLRNEDQQVPKLIQRLAILIFSTYILLKNTHWKDFLFSAKKSPIEVIDDGLIDRIQQSMVEDDFYSKENLTIKKLAERLSEQEYIVRRVINQQLYYRNFTDFLNSYRITEAKNILRDTSQKKLTILEIAYKVGFNSIAPFNRAFKLNTGITPTDYRKKTSFY